jgi:hypothetical protein
MRAGIIPGGVGIMKEQSSEVRESRRTELGLKTQPDASINDSRGMQNVRCLRDIRAAERSYKKYSRFRNSSW